MEQLPVLSSPYVAEIEFLKEVRNENGKAHKKRFDNDHIMSPFYFLLKVKEIENNGTLKVVFYNNSKKNRKQVAERIFNYGKEGKYYEFIIFFDQIKDLLPGSYRYSIFLRNRLIYEGDVQITAPKKDP